ncbi:hypothetical protein K2173_021403 [Erythroxylum novogranatense]|uniref:(S)-hydroxynitrile lyase n=1 Tax=Erythroxylum novogranatense TaxID=1862640 RepID=A0AAV8TUX0_9ROSI|nr:hypothetical protein K2173_021403 [Erythroxylum novogranatense]
MMASGEHFILVHGAGHGAWCWYRLAPLLKLSGHRVDSLDLCASGINPKQLDEVESLSDYAHPLIELMNSLPPDDPVILVGHSYAGYVISLAMEKFPEKIRTAVYLTANMPSSVEPPATTQQEFFKRTPMESLLDCQIQVDERQGNLPISASFGSDYLEKVAYQGCQPEDKELAKTLLRPFKFFLKDLAQESLLTKAKFGSVDRIYVVCKEDGLIKEDLQLWMIENSPTKEVKHIEAGHMVMLSKPGDLCQCLLEIAETNYY